MNRIASNIRNFIPNFHERQHRLHNRRFREHDSLVIQLDSSSSSSSSSSNNNNNNNNNSNNQSSSIPQQSNDSQCILNSTTTSQTNDTMATCLTNNNNNNTSSTPITSSSRSSESRRARRHRRRNHRRNPQQQHRHNSSNYFSTNNNTNNRRDRLSNLFNSNRRQQQQQQQQSQNVKHSERNLLSAFCALFCIAILAVSMVETRWFFLSGGGCNTNYIGVSHFFAPGRLDIYIDRNEATNSDYFVYKFILPNGKVLTNCANREIMLIMRIIIAFIFLSMLSSTIGLLFDTIGCMQPGIKLVRRHGIFHILTVIFCLAINGFSFWISERMYEQQMETRLRRGKRIDVSFDVSYYLIVLASGLSIMATGFTLVRRYSSDDDDDQLNRLLEEYTGFEEPLHLERSLPAITNQCSINNDTIINNNSNIPTDIPSVIISNNNNNEIEINEPPPPYIAVPV